MRRGQEGPHDCIVGIDPGLANCGFAVLSVRKHDQPGKSFPELVASRGLVTAPDRELADRLYECADTAARLFAAFNPFVVVIESMLRAIGQGMAVARVIGAMTYAAMRLNIPVIEYTPTAIKKQVTGNGAARKPEVKEMVRRQVYGSGGRAIDDEIWKGQSNHVIDAIATALTAFHDPTTRDLLTRKLEYTDNNG